jgi:hypothetical protein
VAVEKKYHYKWQANTVRSKSVLSNIYLAIQIIDDERYEINEKDLRLILRTIHEWSQKISDLS